MHAIVVAYKRVQWGTSQNRAPMLTIRSMTGHLADELLHAAAEVNKDSFNDIIVGITPDEGSGLLLLHRASAFGYTHTLDFLLSQRVYNVNERDCKGCTPLHIATALHRPDAVALLLENGADCLIEDDEGEASISTISSQLSVHRIWSYWGTSPEMWYDIHIKTEKWRDDCVTTSLLINAGANLLKPNKHGWNAAQLVRSNPNDGVRIQIRDVVMAERNLAMMMAFHPRLGKNSNISNIDIELIRRIGDSGRF
jgi:hypothetical protein